MLLSNLIFYVMEDVKIQNRENRTNSYKWRPIIMCFQNLHGLHRSTMAKFKSTVRED